MKPISQREARRLRKVVFTLSAELLRLKSSFGRDYPGVNILSLEKGDLVGVEDIAAIHTARRLGHPVVVTCDGTNLHFFGVRP